MSGELKHFGINGQKWGVRRFQNKDGSLTSAGRKRYGVDIESAQNRVNGAKEKVKKLAKEVNQNPFKPNKDTLNKYNKAVGEMNWEKQKLANEKVKDKLNRETKSKSQHRLKLEQKYRESGMSAEEAEIAAYKRSRTEKIIAAVAGTTIAAASAYAVYKHYDNTVDKIIKPGTILQNINDNGNNGVRDAFYFSMNNSDNNKYRGMLGQTLLSKGSDVYETNIGVGTALKVASPKNAQKALSEMIRDKKNLSLLNDRIDEYNKLAPFLDDKQATLFDKAKNALKKGKVDRNVYNAFNVALVGEHGSELNKNFYDTLKSKGYDAIIDMNDKKYSSYSAKKPMIAFNVGNKVTVNSVKKLNDIAVQELGDKETNKLLIRNTLKTMIPSVAAYAGISGAIAVNNRVTNQKQRNKIVSEYRKEHPDTKLSYNEIVENYYKT